VPRENLVGQTIAGYTLQSEVGEGGTSAVFRAQHGVHGTVAVKVLREKLRQDRTAVARFVREARYGERVQHPNVVRTIEIGEATPGMHFLAIEWAGGEILEKYAKRQGPLPVDEVVAILAQIADAVHAAHSVGIVHRDLKPDNVMVLASKTGEVVKLVDFGIAKALMQEPSGGVTAPGTVIGTPDYMAPEQFAGDPVDPRADIYALGVMFYRMATGSLPHQGESARETLTKRLTEPPRPLAGWRVYRGHRRMGGHPGLPARDWRQRRERQRRARAQDRTRAVGATACRSADSPRR
jgi:serine/threonine-protein kinase